LLSDERSGWTAFRGGAAALKLAAGGAGAVNPKDKDPLLFIAKVDYRGYAIKIARRGQEIRLLVHAPGKVFAAQMITDALANYENALQQARQAIDDMIEAEES
jgi:hypothetical protein